MSIAARSTPHHKRRARPSFVKMRSVACGVLVALCCAALGGCWGVTGRPLALPPEGLLTRALEAHHRGDDRAFRTLLVRLVEEAPDSREARVARALLLSLPPARYGLQPEESTVGAQEP